MPDNVSGTLVFMALLVLASAFFSAAETAYSSLNMIRLKTMAEHGSRKAQLALGLAESYDSLLSAILIGNNIVNIALASMAAALFVELCGDIGSAISTVVVTIAVLIFGEVTPKSMAKECPETFAVMSAPVLRLLIRVLGPVNMLFSRFKKCIAGLFQLREERRMSQEELLLFVDEAGREGSIDEEERVLLRNAIEFGETTAEEILTHRMVVTAAPVDSDLGIIEKIFAETKLSRLPIYEESIDHIIGILHVKDFYQAYYGMDRAAIHLRELLVRPVTVSASEPVDIVLKKLQKEKAHVAVVADSYGGVCGIVTMEDILEELVGEIEDEHDD